MLRSIKDTPYLVWLIACAHAVTDLAPGALFVALPYFKVKFGLNYAELTAIVLLQNLTSSVSQPVFGYLSDKKPHPWWMPVGCLLTGFVMLASLQVPNYALVLICTAISGFGSAIFHPEAAKTVNWLSGQAKGRGASLFSVGGNIGFALGSFFLGALLLGDSYMLYLFALPYVITVSAFLPVRKSLLRAPQNQKIAGAAKKSAVKFNLALLALLGMVLARATVNSGISTFVPLYYMSFLHGTQAYSASLLTVFLAAGAVGTLLGGTSSDKYGSRRVMLCSIMPVAFLLYAFKLASGIWPFVILAAVGVLLAATFTSSLVLAQKMMPNNIAMASGLTLGFSIGLGSMGVLLLGQVADMAGLPLVFDVLAFLPVAAFILTLFIEEPQPVPQAGECVAK